MFIIRSSECSLHSHNSTVIDSSDLKNVLSKYILEGREIQVHFLNLEYLKTDVFVYKIIGSHPFSSIDFVSFCLEIVTKSVL